MGRIGICHFRTGDIDGVSLEIDKSRQVLHQLGHQTFLCTGRCGMGEEAFVIPEMSLDHPEVLQIRRNAFERLADYRSERDLHDHIEGVAARIEARVAEFLTGLGIDLLVVHNLWGLPLNLPATVGVWRAVEVHQLPVLAHHHDFHWEREEYRSPTAAGVRDLVDKCFPPRSPRVTHIVINRIAHEELRRRGIPSTVVPNVFDFHSSPTPRESRWALLEHLGLSLADVVFLQATRIVRRKGIEIALELVARLGSPEHRGALHRRVRERGGGFSGRPVVLLPNLVEDRGYCEALRERAARLGVDARFVSDRVASTRRPGCLSLWDTYLCADFVTYPSLQEGWGNQFLEAVWARLPMAVYEYPVFRSDIAPAGFQYVSLGHSYERDEDGLARVPEPTLRRAAQEVADLLSRPDRYRQLVEHNYALGKARFSLQILMEELNRLVSVALQDRPGTGREPCGR
ncbi:glycosyltransferase family 4 protein [Candidatus Bipolaricaulota bacterium]|nr:glycosyltransferase family 4 protein [Candidatus Bipolaricaulota bacterium]